MLVGAPTSEGPRASVPIIPRMVNVTCPGWISNDISTLPSALLENAVTGPIAYRNLEVHSSPAFARVLINRVKLKWAAKADIRLSRYTFVEATADLVRAVNLLPATCGQSRTDCSAEEAKDGRDDGLSFVASANDRLWRTIGIYGCTRPEAGASSNGCADECVAAAMPRALGIHLLDALTRDRLIRSSGVDYDGIVADRSKLARVGLSVIQHNTNLLVVGHLFKRIPGRTLGVQ